MHTSLLLVLGATLPLTHTFSLPTSSNIKEAVRTVFTRKNDCPSVWSAVSSDLTSSFLANGECTGLARAAIRYAFHDAGTFSTKLPFNAPAGGGADGSLLLNVGEINRKDNGGLQEYHSFITGKYDKYKSQGVGAADLIQFAGNHAVVTCPGGPKVKTVVGRTDSAAASPEGIMPPGFGPGSDHDSLLQLFKDKGFSAEDLAALVGAHSTSTNIAQAEIPKGAPQDSTPGKWDVNFYGQTYSPPQGVFRFDSDVSLSNKSTAVGKQFSGFVNNQGKWNGKFADAMYRLSVLGIPSSTAKNFIDCTDVLPRGTSSKRDIRGAPVNDRAV